MKLYYFCSSCKKENSFTTKASNRYELKEERGEHINERCPRCGMITKRHINRVHAKPNKLIILFGALIGTIVLLIVLSVIPTFILLFVIPGVFSIPFLAWKITDKRASKFNKLLLTT